MTQTTTRERTTERFRRYDEVATPTRSAPAPSGAILRTLGALTLLAVGAVHLDQYFAVHFQVIPTIGPLFVLNFAAATAMGLLLLVPFERMPGTRRAFGALLALGGIGLAATSFVFLFLSEHQPLFGFQDYGYRPAVIAALVAEAATVVLLGSYLAVLQRRP
jgi:hypothetical protein